MLDITQVRSRFPALARTFAGEPVVYLDGPGGTQVPDACIRAMVDYLSRCNANHDGVFVTSQESDAIVAEAHEAMADLLNASGGAEIVFGQNMTSLAFALSRSLAHRLAPGDEIVLTRLDHDANFTPWLMMAKERGATVHVVDIREEDCTLDLEQLGRCLNRRTKLVAFGYASNAVGTINPVGRIVAMAREVGALTFVDAVHYAPHGPIDVQALGCDFLACSPYKFFAPHLGVLYGRLDALDDLPAYKVRPADDRLPGRLETGTLSHESLAGLLGTVEYLEWLGGFAPTGALGHWRTPRAAALHRAMGVIESWEQGLKTRLLEGLLSLPGVRIHGITDPRRLAERVPTFAIRIAGHHPRDVATALGEAGIFVWDGNYYALNLSERLGVEETGGMVRVGPVHYNTPGEIDRLLAALPAATASR